VTKAGGNAGFLFLGAPFSNSAQPISGRHRTPSISRFSRVKYAQHHQTFSVEAILEDVSRAQDLQYNLSVFFPASDRPSQHWMFRQHLHLADDFTGHDASKRWMLSVKKFNETVNIGKSSIRPLQLHRFRQLRNAGVPHV
jgi:hypothetical protein